ncbi:c-type cytochrome [Marinomonas fungiae]|uniref:Cytochrome C oxidase, cbb3-type, subunit III n=1 Tax=Marinomonas fungiae TaxID=1137284 RepID=A0A0K6IIZ3_9GAMM|nr:cytochrome c [Marinomonas fungiae]CUB03297.1 Cytochrome C oxidase, cbb3-type, subunit III [Marinomonas fungiae]
MKIWLIALVIVSLVGCSDYNDKTTTMQGGKELYENYCAGCHRSRGTGQFLIGVPRIKDTELSLSEIADVIRRQHKDERQMPIFSQLTVPQSYSIASYIKNTLRYK